MTKSDSGESTKRPVAQSESSFRQDITDWAAPGWFSDDASSSIWITAYMTGLVAGSGSAPRPVFIDLPGARVVLMNGTLTYFDAGAGKLEPGDTGMLTASFAPREATTPPGIYSVVLLPYDVDGVPGVEPETRAKVGAIAGLIGAVGGRTLVFDKLYDNIRSMSRGKTTAFSRAMLNPGALVVPRIDAGRIGLAQAIGAAAFQESKEGARLRLSLRWFDASVQSDDNVDSFIRCWIALETFAMPDSTNIAPINEALVSVYGLSDSDTARDRFRVGRLYGLRGDIVHSGSPTSLNGAVDEYLRAIYVDTLLFMCAVPSDKRAEAVRSSNATALREYLGRDFGT